LTWAQDTAKLNKSNWWSNVPWFKPGFRRANLLKMPYAALKERSSNRTLLRKLSVTFYLKPGEKHRVREALASKRNRKKARKEHSVIPEPFPSNGPVS
jgi:hypothetical protein